MHCNPTLQRTTLHLAVCAFISTLTPWNALAQETKTLAPVTVTATKTPDMGGVDTDKASLKARRTLGSDSAGLLQDLPGVSLYGAGGVSSLPAIRGLGDDRIRIQVDGMDLMAACPNHMNSPLSYIDPTRVETITVFAGITPVSVGGDSIGGTIQVRSAPPEFADSAEAAFGKGQIGSFYRSNGGASGYNAAATWVGNGINVSYAGSYATSANFKAGGDFKAAGPGTTGSAWLTGDEVGSSKYTSENQDVGVALRGDKTLLQLNVGTQHIPFEGFPNQRMDMTGNDSTQINLRYTGQYQWGQLTARAYDQDTVHAMNMGPDRFSYGTLGMPMNSKAKTQGAMLQADWVLSERDILKTGVETQTHTLNDWWPQAGGVMGPSTFWNMDLGTRDRMGTYGEWESLWSEQWMSLIGMRFESVTTDAGPVQGYNAQAIWATDAATFNAKDRKRTDSNVDLTALIRHTPSVMRTFEAGFARKVRSPNLYQRYPWATQPMATLMNNFAGDGNGYVGNINLKPEVAYTLSASGDWHDEENKNLGFKTTAYITHVQDYIDVQRCNFGQCGGAANLTATTGFVNLQYVNQSARLYGLDFSANASLGESDFFGSFKGNGVLSFVRGSNLDTGDNLYNIMPLNAKISVHQRVGGWTNTVELQLVASKSDVSHARNEVPTTGYGLLNLRSSREWKKVRLDMGIENLLNRYYAYPLGGAYTGQGASMTSLGIPWGTVVPGMGRSVNVAINYSF
jgi:iron complex outermembrane receptor protein